jgi:hypothetical protein
MRSAWEGSASRPLKNSSTQSSSYSPSSSTFLYFSIIFSKSILLPDMIWPSYLRALILFSICSRSRIKLLYFYRFSFNSFCCIVCENMSSSGIWDLRV